MRIERIEDIERELTSTGNYRLLGNLGLTVVSMALAAMPSGGPFAVMVDGLKKKFLEPDFEKYVVALSQELASVGRDLASVKERVAFLSEKIGTDASFESRLRSLMQELLESQREIVDFDNDGGRNNIVDIIVEDMKLHSRATNGATTNITGAVVTGSAKFETGINSEQNIKGSKFSSRRESFGVDVVLNKASMLTGSIVEIAPPGTNVGMRVTRVFGPDDEGGAAMTITPSGISFGGPNKR